MIIGLTGGKGSGKSLCAQHLVRNHGFTRIAFADPLKSMLSALGLTRAQLYGEEKELPDPITGSTPRHLMQTLGTEWGRKAVDGDLWVNIWRHRIDSLRSALPTARVVADDVRFANEVGAIRALGGCVWEVRRPSLEVSDPHISERGVIGADLALYNIGTPGDLTNALDAHVKFLTLQAEGKVTY